MEATSQAKYLALDSETGGVNPKINPILTAYFAAVSEDLVIIDELNLKIKPKDGMIIEKEALEVNKINMDEHLASPDLVTPEQAKELIQAFNKKHKPSGKSKLRPLGHNVIFDEMALWEQVMTQDEWEKNVSYGRIDTKVLCDMLKDAGLLPPELGNLGSVSEHFGVSVGTAHEAKSDVLTAINVYAKMLEMLKTLKSGASILTGDLLSQIER